MLQKQQTQTGAGVMQTPDSKQRGLQRPDCNPSFDTLYKGTSVFIAAFQPFTRFCFCAGFVQTDDIDMTLRVMAVSQGNPLGVVLIVLTLGSLRGVMVS